MLPPCVLGIRAPHHAALSAPPSLQQGAPWRIFLAAFVQGSGLAPLRSAHFLRQQPRLLFFQCLDDAALLEVQPQQLSGLPRVSALLSSARPHRLRSSLRSGLRAAFSCVRVVARRASAAHIVRPQSPRPPPLYLGAPRAHFLFGSVAVSFRRSRSGIKKAPAHVYRSQQKYRRPFATLQR